MEERQEEWKDKGMERKMKGETEGTERRKQTWKEGRQSEGAPALSTLSHQHGAGLQSHPMGSWHVAWRQSDCSSVWTVLPGKGTSPSLGLFSAPNS